MTFSTAAAAFISSFCTFWGFFFRANFTLQRRAALATVNNRRRVCEREKEREREALPSYRHRSTRRILRDDRWRRSDLLSRQSKDPWLPVHDKPMLAHLSVFPCNEKIEVAKVCRGSRQIIKSHRGRVARLTSVDLLSTLKSKVIQSQREFL